MTAAVRSSIMVDPVAPSVDSVIEGIRSRVARVPAGQSRVTFDFGTAGRWVADRRRSSFKPLEHSEPSADAEITLEPRVMARILNGDMDPRHALLFGRMTIKGSVAVAIACCEELAGRRFAAQMDYSEGVPAPAPTQDRALARRQLRVHGYAIICDVLLRHQVRELRDRLVDQAAAEREAGVAFFDGGRAAEPTSEGSREQWWLASQPHGRASSRQPNQRVWALHNEG